MFVTLVLLRSIHNFTYHMHVTAIIALAGLRCECANAAGCNNKPACSRQSSLHGLSLAILVHCDSYVHVARYLAKHFDTLQPHLASILLVWVPHVISIIPTALLILLDSGVSEVAPCSRTYKFQHWFQIVPNFPNVSYRGRQGVQLRHQADIKPGGAHFTAL